MLPSRNEAMASPVCPELYAVFGKAVSWGPKYNSPWGYGTWKNGNLMVSQVTAPLTPHRPPRCCKQLTAQSTVTKATKCNTMQPKTAFSTPSHPVACARRDGFSAAVIMADTGQELGSARAARRRVTLANPPENRASTMVEYLPSICAGETKPGRRPRTGAAHASGPGGGGARRGDRCGAVGIRQLDGGEGGDTRNVQLDGSGTIRTGPAIRGAPARSEE